MFLLGIFGVVIVLISLVKYNFIVRIEVIVWLIGDVRIV